MYNKNIDVDNGIANGTTCSLEKVYLKHDAKLQPIQVHGYWINAVSIEDVDHLQLHWEGSERFQGTFNVFQEMKLFTVKFHFTACGQKVQSQEKMHITHFPVSLNHATTGHKLQGKSLKQLVIAQWSAMKNWAYVVLSRVTTLDGLYLLEPIPENIDFSPIPEYLDMMTRLQQRILAVPTQIANLKRGIQDKLDKMSNLVKDKMIAPPEKIPELNKKIQQQIEEIMK